MEKLKFKNGRITVAVGEGAGKRHEVLEAPGVEIFSHEGNFIVKTAEMPTQIVHPEHGTLTIPAYEEVAIVIQEEYDGLQGYRKTRD